MSDYIQQIEDAYSKCRGRWSILSPLDWHIAAAWEEKGIPVHIVIRAIDECCKKFKSKRDPGNINTVRYFEQAVLSHFARWNAARVGSNDAPAVHPDDQPNAADLAIEVCEHIILKFGEAKITCPPYLHDPVAIVIDAVSQLILQLEGDGDTTQTDDHLQAIEAAFDQAILTTAPDRAKLLADLHLEFPQYTSVPSAYDLLLLKTLYDRQKLPRLSLYQIR